MKRKTFNKICKYIVLVSISFFFLIPFTWMLISSLKPPVKVFETPMEWFPKDPRFRNYVKLFTEYKFHKYVFNTLKLCVLNVIGTTFSCTFVAYAFTFSRWKKKNIFFILVLATMMLPGAVVFFPQFILFVKIKWYGTLLPLWATSFFANAYYVFFLRQYFLTIPRELINAARIDGCGDLKMIWNVVIPMAKPVYIVMIMNTFIAVWGDFFNQLIYITRNNQKTISLGLTMLNSSYGNISNSTLPSLMAGSFIVSIPVLAVYYFGQKMMMQTYVFRDTGK